MINTTTTDLSSAKGPPQDNVTSPESNSHDDEDNTYMYRSRKSYPQRKNRPKLNYRDLERGVYDRHEFRQSIWALGGPTLLKEGTDRSNKTDSVATYSDDEEEDEEDRLGSTNDQDEDMISDGKKKSNEESSEQMHRRLWCICKKPWDHSRLMLRCDSCSNWYHGDCIGMTKEQARILDMKGDQFVCPPCQGLSKTSARLSDESPMIKRKHSSPAERKAPENTSAKTQSQPEAAKRPKTGIFFHRDAAPEPQIHCIVHGCSNWAKPGWIYCSPACIRRHINETLQAIQRSKGPDNENPPLREDILLYENRTKKLLDRKLVPKIEDLCTWINEHPSYEIVKPALRQSILLTANESKAASPINPNLSRSNSVSSPKTPTTPTAASMNKVKPSWVPIAPNTNKTAPVKKAPVTLTKPTTGAKPTQNNNVADIRSKVPTALFDKLLMRVEKSDEKNVSKEEIRTMADKIEEEMFRVFGKVDNSYKNKFRSLLANISNMNNNYFYKQILSKEVTAKQIVAMKPEDMLPPEEKEKRKDEFEKEVQMIMKAEEQTAEEMARRARIKVTRQGLVENDAVPAIFKPTAINITEEKKSDEIVEEKAETDEDSTKTKPVIKTKITESSTSMKPATPPSPPLPTEAEAPKPIVTKSPSPPPIPQEKPVEQKRIPSPPLPMTKVSTPDEINPIYPSSDVDNDYIEPESPTGIDALIYDDDDELNHSSSYSRSSSISQSKALDSPNDVEFLQTKTTTNRDDYNPSIALKPKVDSSSTQQKASIARLSWRGSINLPDMKIPCQSSRTFGDAEYLVGEIPEQLTIVGRLRLTDLWNYARDSLPVRDVILLNLTSDHPSFHRYVDQLRSSGRPAVLAKKSEPSPIRDMYILAADTKECPPAIFAALTLPTTFDPKHLFLLIIASGKRTIKSSARANDSPSISNLTYKPVSLQENASLSTAARDPRLSRNKDPRLPSASASAILDITVPPPVPVTSSIDHAKKIIQDTFEHIRHASSMETIQSLAHSTTEFLKSNAHMDLYAQFAQQLPLVIAAWQPTMSAGPTKKADLPNDDNLNEENMEVEDQSEDRHQKKNLSFSEFNDVDYRFLDQGDVEDHLASLANNDRDSDLRAKETKRT